MQKIPQAVAMILLMSALGCPLCSAQTGEFGRSVSGPAHVLKAEGEIRNLIREFLSKVNDPAMHDRFWADDLVYVGAGGTVRTKAEIMKNVTEEAGKAKSESDKKDDSSFDAEDIKLRTFGQHGDVWVLNFRLVAKSDGKTSYYRNSGVLVERNGKWQVISWQATKEPEPKLEAEGRK
jgi:hypothetical protein